MEDYCWILLKVQHFKRLIWRNKLVFMSSWVHMDLAKVACFFAISFKPDMPTEPSITGACAIIILAITRASYKIDRKILK